MDILVITINYPPEIGGAPHLIHALASNLKARGHDVTVLTGYPHYNIKEVPEQYRRGLWLKENLDGICVRRIRIPSLPRANKIARGLEHFISGLVGRPNQRGSSRRYRGGLFAAIAAALAGQSGRQGATNAGGRQHPGPFSARGGGTRNADSTGTHPLI